jgi:excisionase family DNA binding protein
VEVNDFMEWIKEVRQRGIFVTTEVGTELIHPIESRQENYFRDLSFIITGLASAWVLISRGQFIEAAEKGEIMDLIQELRARENFLSTAEVMKLLQLRRGTLCEWVRAGRIPAIRVGNAYPDL